MDSAETGTRQAKIIRPNEVDDNDKISSLLPYHIRTDNMHEITEKKSPQYSHARPRTPQPVTNLTPVLLSTKQSTPKHKHGPLIRPKLHDTDTNTNKPGPPATTLTNGKTSSPKHESHAHATLSPHEHLLPLDHLNHLMSCPFIETSNNEEVTYVRIPIHPQAWVAWNQMT